MKGNMFYRPHQLLHQDQFHQVLRGPVLEMLGMVGVLEGENVWVRTPLGETWDLPWELYPLFGMPMMSSLPTAAALCCIVLL